ncbi:MAG TPA: CaiB/BaiF CoA-transferase family protein [Chitinophagales bacterium]|nr:CaiB/BaiF CoA-transferase family protein [Chitinophagales bacterium]
MTRPPKQGPLKGLRVIDFTRLLPGPLATMLLAEMGADVIKVENPNSPDYIRFFPPPAGSDSAFYLSLNRSKRSLAVNYSTSEGKDIICRLSKNADILIEQFRPGVMSKMGLGYDELKKINPAIIYVSVSGYGQSGPYAQKAGHDINYIGYSGLLATTGERGRAPVLPGGQVADVAAGAYMAVNAALAALYAREKTGQGQHADVAMLDCVMPLTALQTAQYYATKKEHERGTFALSGGMANYNVYECADGKYIALGALELKFWEHFCDLVSRPQWKIRILDSGDAMDALKKEVAALFIAKPRHEWVKLGEEKDVCITPVLDISELEHDPQIHHRKMIVDAGQENYTGFKTIGIPLKFSKTQPQIAWQAPRLGEDTLDVLKELGYDEEDINRLAGKSVVTISKRG